MKRRQVSVYGDMTGAEIEVADFLARHNIYWLFEQPVFLMDEKDRPRVWNPDFYLPELGVYIEVCGTPRDKDYNYRRDVYNINAIPVIFVQTYKGPRWKNYLLSQLNAIHEMRWEIIRNINL